MKILAYIGGSLLWFVVVFFAVFLLTWPSGAVTERVRYEVQSGSDGAYALELAGVRPTFVGARLVEPALLSRSGDAVRELLAVDSARVSTGVMDALRLGLLGGEGDIAIRLKDGAGKIDATVSLVRDETVEVRGVEVDGAIPLSVIPPMGGASLLGGGEIEIDAYLSWEGGLSKSNGRISLDGSGLRIDGIASDDEMIAGFLDGFEGLPAAIDQLEIELDIDDGKAVVKRGRLLSDLINLDIDGEVTLADDVTKSRVRLQLVFELGQVIEDSSGAALIKGLLKTALWADGKYHYTWSGVLGRLRAPRAERERAKRTPARRPTTSTGRTQPTRPSKTAAEPRPSRATNPPPPSKRRGQLATDAEEDELEDLEDLEDLEEELDEEDLEEELEEELDDLEFEEE